MTTPFRFFRKRLGRRLLVAVHLVALLLAAALLVIANGRDFATLAIGVSAQVVAALTMSLLATAPGVGWNRIGPRDERQRQRWLESKALAYPILLAVMFPCLFWFSLLPLGVTSVDGSTPRNGWLASVLAVTMVGLPIAISAWREPDPAEE